MLSKLQLKLNLLITQVTSISVESKTWNAFSLKFSKYLVKLSCPILGISLAISFGVLIK